MNLHDFLYKFIPSRDDIPIVVTKNEQQLASFVRVFNAEAHMPVELLSRMVDCVKLNKTEMTIYVK